MNNPASVALEVMHVLVQDDWPRNLLSHDPGQNSPTEDRVSANVLNGTRILCPELPVEKVLALSLQFTLPKMQAHLEVPPHDKSAMLTFLSRIC